MLSEEITIVLNESFWEIDKDGDGLINKQELIALMNRLGQYPTEIDIQNMLKGLDNNSNENINFTQFLSIIPGFEKCNHDEEEEEFIESCKAFDKDNTGVISIKEFKSVLRNTVIADDTEINEVIKDAGFEGYEMINYQEFLKALGK